MLFLFVVFAVLAQILYLYCPRMSVKCTKLMLLHLGFEIFYKWDYYRYYYCCGWLMHCEECPVDMCWCRSSDWVLYDVWALQTHHSLSFCRLLPHKAAVNTPETTTLVSSAPLRYILVESLSGRCKVVMLLGWSLFVCWCVNGVTVQPVIDLHEILLQQMSSLI